MSELIITVIMSYVLSIIVYVKARRDTKIQFVKRDHEIDRLLIQTYMNELLK